MTAGLLLCWAAAQAQEPDDAPHGIEDDSREEWSAYGFEEESYIAAEDFENDFYRGAGDLGNGSRRGVGGIEDDSRRLVTDSTLFYVPLGDASSLFDNLTRYSLTFVSYRRRALDDRFRRLALDNLELSGGISKYCDFGLAAAIEALAPDCAPARSDDLKGIFSPLHTTAGSASASLAQHSHSAVVSYSQRRYRTGVRLKSAAPLPRNWYYALTARLRSGDDSFVAGYWSHTLSASLALEKIFDNRARLKIFLLAAQNDYSSRAWTEPQTFALTGDNCYNPYWGFLDGSIKSSRTNSEFIPLAMCSAVLPLSGGIVRLSAAVRAGHKTASALQWFDAPNPTPDYYRNLPSHVSDQRLADALCEAWQSGDASFTQIDWERLREVNLLAGTQPAHYLISSRNRRYRDCMAAVSFENTVSDRSQYAFGLRVRQQRTSYFRTPEDLLGGLYVMNRDPYTGVSCDVNSPLRPVLTGEHYDYDYDVTLRSAVLYAETVVTGRHLRAAAGAELAFESYWRCGNFMRQGLESVSYGKSGVLSFTPFQVYADAGYHFSVRHRVGLRVFAAEYAPHYENVFLLPEYANTTLRNVHTVRAAGISAEYRLPLAPVAEVAVAGYCARFSHETQIMRYYDDLCSAYAVAAMENISKSDWNVEASLHADVTERLALSAAFSTGAYLYAGNPDITILDAGTLKPLVTGEVALLKDYVHTPTPQTLLVLRGDFRSLGNWTFTADWAWVSRRYVALNPLRRTSRAANAAPSPEDLLLCIRQERLADAGVVNVGVSKGFSLKGARIFVAAHIYNLLNRRNIIYGGYEQMRFDRHTLQGGGTAYTPFPSRYCYAFPRTLIISLSVGFL